jgi:hypothetical protein
MSDFTNIIRVAVPFTATELDAGVDFVPSGDLGTITITGSGFGEGRFGETPFGGTQTVIVSAGKTNWTNIETP